MFLAMKTGAVHRFMCYLQLLWWRAFPHHGHPLESMRRTDGFSLIELLIVVAIILVIAALAIPNLVRSKMSANEAAAVQSVRAIGTAQAGYAVAYPALGYADSLPKLSMPAPGQPVSPNAAGFLDWVLGCAAQPCSKNGYSYTVLNPQGAPVVSYDITAVPVTLGSSGTKGFCADQVGVILVDPQGGTSCTVPLQ
jgi:type IV pilus assembly protein PilA